MPCHLKRPTIVVEEDTVGDIQKLTGFILHGVAHAFDDGNQVATTYFVTFDNNSNIAVVNAHEVGEMTELAVKETVEDLNGEMVACVSEAWALPIDKTDAQRNGTSGYASIEDHPDKIEVIVISVETSYGNWVTRIDPVDGKRVLPDTVTFERVADDTQPYPGFASLLPQKAPAGVLLH